VQTDLAAEQRSAFSVEPDESGTVVRDTHGGPPPFPGLHWDLVLQRVLVDRPVALRPLYWTLTPAHLVGPGGEVQPDGGLLVEPGAVLGFDTYFGAFYEQPWRLHTGLRALFLRLDLRGACTLRVFRRTTEGRQLVVEQGLRGEGPVRIAIPDGAINFRQHGMLVFEIAAREPVAFLNASWVTDATAPKPVGLAAVFCTFNRETDIAAVLTAITAEDAVLSRLARIYVVNQGGPGLEAHPAVAPLVARHGAKLRIIEQGNFGGAGGFGRGLLAALDDPAVTHAVVLDDDIRIEADSLLRMASFFALATGNNPVGGHMLDMVRPMQLYEGGAVIRDANWSFHPQHHGLDLGDPDNLPSLLGPQPIHYNGWWCLGIPLALIEEAGMPLPCFIRGDDVEFGLRLHQHGVHTLAMPGIGVWHEPFYLKFGGWQLYYETRNMLIAAALHLDVDARGMVVRIARALLIQLLTFRYYGAALIIRAVADFLRGPEILDGAPGPLHAELGAIRERFPAESIARGRVLPMQEPLPPPRGRIGWAASLLRSVAQSAMRPTVPQAGPRRLEMAAFGWSRLGRADCIALETWWDQELPVFRRSRENFWELVWASIPLLRRLHRKAPVLGQRWREAFPRHRSIDFWRGYLGLAPEARPHGPSDTDA
jgi:galactofuranosylgalactofuranosylrhamnosyl-N-acetylglucosaminyl-diphospho-decaprenol beta-1,5/1,6-galactofuranosyltransferase